MAAIAQPTFPTSGGLSKTGNAVSVVRGTGANQTRHGNDAAYTDPRVPTTHAASHAFGGGDAVTVHVEQTNGDSDVTVTAGVTILRQTAALSAARGCILPPTSAYADGATFTFVDIYSVTGMMGFGVDFGDTINLFSISPGSGVVMFEKSGTTWFQLPLPHYGNWVATNATLQSAVETVTDIVDEHEVRLDALEPSINDLFGSGTVLNRGLKYFDTLIADRTLTFDGIEIAGQITSLNLTVTGGPWTLTIPTSYRLGETGSITSLILGNGRHELSWRYDGTDYILSDTAIELTVTPTALSGNVDNYDPTGLAYASVLRIDGGASDRSITGLDASTFADGRALILINIGATNKLTLANQSGSSTAANRFLLPADTEIAVNTSLVLRYDGVSSRFRPFSRALSNTGVTAGSYGSATTIPIPTFDAQGRATSVTIATIDVAGTQTGTHAAPSTTNPLAPTWTSPVHTVWYGATGEIDLPVVASYTNKALLVYNTGAFTITIDPNASEIIVRDGTVQTGGVTFTLSSGAGNYVALFSDGARWITLGYKGTLAVGS